MIYSFLSFQTMKELFSFIFLEQVIQWSCTSSHPLNVTLYVLEDPRMIYPFQNLYPHLLHVTEIIILFVEIWICTRKISYDILSSCPLYPIKSTTLRSSKLISKLSNLSLWFSNDNMKIGCTHVYWIACWT